MPRQLRGGIIVTKNKPEESLSKNFMALLSEGIPVQVVGSIPSVIFLWIILQYTKSAIMGSFYGDLSELGILLMIPISLFISRTSGKRRLYLMAHFSMLLSGAIVLLVMLTGDRVLELAAIFIMGFVVSVMGLFYRSINQFWSREFLKRGEYQKGSSYYMVIFSASYIASYALAGILTYINYYFSLAIYIVGVLLSILLIFRIHPESENYEPPERRSFRKSYSEIIKNRSMKEYLIFIFFVNCIGAPLMLVILELVMTRFSNSSFALTIILTVGMAGGLFGSFLSSKIKKGNIKNFMIISLIPVALTMFILTFLSQYILVTIDLFFYILFFSFHSPFSENLEYKIADQKQVVQLYSIRDTLRIIAYIVFLTIGGFLIEFVGLDYALYMSTLLAVISILIIYASKDLAKYTVQ